MLTRRRRPLAALAVSMALIGLPACGSGVQQAPSNARGATARCRDGTFSYSQHHQGTCSWHGGVATWYR
jgi:hypothetical protein